MSEQWGLSKIPTVRNHGYILLETVEILVRDHGKEITSATILHSDQGCHYTSYKFIELLKNRELRQSMSRKANCWDNAPQESFFGHMKDEIDSKIKKCSTFEKIKAVITDWMNYYNKDRYIWDLAMLSPDEYYKYYTTGVYPIPGMKPPKGALTPACAGNHPT